ncbi:sensor histidine kinase [Ruminiclostridium josui]|uniref:sensor histidine kinase n=1 Tax=Ruminiclostridium josui TaxID=1499 RepID=UPI000463D235|nr:HAMP domain-containing sensor histidine kinase [Ruminiclostridium josui]
MFKKLRNRFLISNLVIISVMLIISFASIYLITYKNVSSEIKMELHRIEDSYFKHNDNMGQHPPDFGIQKPPKRNDIDSPHERIISFMVKTDLQWNIIDKASFFNVEDELYENAKKKAISKNNNTGNFNIENEHWTFSITPIMNGYRLVFMDTTSQYEILKTLIYTFLFVALIMFIIIYFISRFFANRSIKPVQEAFERQKQFIADASHELKTPLAVINTNVDVLLSNKRDTIESQSKWLNYIKSESERMAKLTNDLLYLTQMDNSDNKIIFSNFNMSEAVENIILTMEAVIYERNLSLIYELEPELFTYGNDEQIRQVVMILLDNAIKYSNTNGTISIALYKQNSDIILSITNTGEGIAPEHLKKIFDRFYRTDKSRSRRLGGYGLGLAIAKAIVDQHNGKIYAESTLNVKTTFFVKLPLVFNYMNGYLTLI